jgi:hypothetical protein
MARHWLIPRVEEGAHLTDAATICIPLPFRGLVPGFGPTTFETLEPLFDSGKTELLDSLQIDFERIQIG